MPRPSLDDQDGESWPDEGATRRGSGTRRVALSLGSPGSRARVVASGALSVLLLLAVIGAGLLTLGSNGTTDLTSTPSSTTTPPPTPSTTSAAAPPASTGPSPASTGTTVPPSTGTAAEPDESDAPAPEAGSPSTTTRSAGPAPAPAPRPPREQEPEPAGGGAQGGEAVFYANCGEARRAGAAPLLAGEPGYRPELDGNGDGVACGRS